MEKEPQPDSMATVTIKPDYPPSEVYSSEPPPAYHKTQSSAVQVAKIIAVTVILVSVVLGSFLLASAYVTANASCRQLEQELELLSEAADKFQAPLQPEALVQDEPQHQKRQSDPLESSEDKDTKEIDKNDIDSDSSSSSSSNDSSDNSDSNSDSSSSNESDEEKTIHFKLPLQLDFDDLAGALIEKNQKSRMNCIVEKKRAEEVVDHQPKTLRLPFGLNLTTDPKYERLSGERMAIFCESGNFQRNIPQPPQQQQQPEQDDEEETIMIQPVMIPIPQTHFPTHMAQQMQPQAQQPQQRQFQHIHPMEGMRPPMPTMMNQQAQQPQPGQQQNLFPPNPILQHIAQQIITQKIMEAQRAREEQQGQEVRQNEIEQQRPSRFHPAPEGMVQQRIPLPEDVITQLNRLPNRDMIVAISEQEPEVPQEMRAVVQEQRQSPHEMNGRQTYARQLPVHIPVHMIQQEQEQEQEQEQPQEPQAAASEESRPHYVQPRSIRSVDALLPKSQKRVKRCSCDCAC